MASRATLRYVETNGPDSIYRVSHNGGGGSLIARCAALVKAKDTGYRHCMGRAAYHVKGRASYLLCTSHNRAYELVLPHQPLDGEMD